MAERGPHEALIDVLASDLRPVRPLRSPWLRALGWLAVVGAVAMMLAVFGGLGTVSRRLAGSSDECAATAGAAATAVLAAFAAFLLSVPDRRPGWALLPLPALLVWMCASTIGCLRGDGAAGPDAHAPQACFTFIVVVSAPLSLLLFLMLRRAYPVRPGLTAALGGLAAAAAAATLLEFFHPFDVTTLDLLSHLAAVLFVIGANRVLSGPALRGAIR